MKHIGADHDACSALAGLAVDNGDVVAMLLQIRFDVLAERLNEFERGRVVIVEAVAHDAMVKRGGVVVAFRAEIVDFVVVRMAIVEESGDVFDVISKHALEFVRGKAHGDDVRLDVGQVEIVAFLLKASLLFRHHLSKSIRHH